MLRTYPDTIVGIKDSSGDWSNTKAILDEYPTLATFCGSEVFLLDTLRHGGAGSITASANINAAQIRSLFAAWQDDRAQALQDEITAVRRAYEIFPTIPALKAVAAAYYDQAGWMTVRPPLRALDESEQQALLASLTEAGFTMGA